MPPQALGRTSAASGGPTRVGGVLGGGVGLATGLVGAPFLHWFRAAGYSVGTSGSSSSLQHDDPLDQVVAALEVGVREGS